MALIEILPNGDLNISPYLLATFILLILIDTVLRAISLWKSARKDQLAWFVCLLIFNTLGILPLVYLILNRDKKEKTVSKRKNK
jgi:hypothetical protein